MLNVSRWMDRDGDGYISIKEFQTAFRRFRRLTNPRAVAKEQAGRAIMHRLTLTLQRQVMPLDGLLVSYGWAVLAQGRSLQQLFVKLDRSGDGILARYELRKGLAGQRLLMLTKLEAAQVMCISFSSHLLHAAT